MVSKSGLKTSRKSAIASFGVTVGALGRPKGPTRAPRGRNRSQMDLVRLQNAPEKPPNSPPNRENRVERREKKREKREREERERRQRPIDWDR